MQPNACFSRSVRLVIASSPHAASLPSALITGASSGLGRALARELAPITKNLLLSARRHDLLESLKNEALSLGAEKVVCIPGDLGTAEGAEGLAQSVRTELGSSPLLFAHCAGEAIIGKFHEVPSEAAERNLNINFRSAQILAASFLPEMLARASGRFIFISSGLAHRGFPNMAHYCSSKAALTRMAETFTAQYSEHGIHTLLIYPLRMDTDQVNNPKVFGNAVVPTETASAHPPEQVARKIVSAMNARRSHLDLSWKGRILQFANAVSPSLVDRLSSRFTI